MKKCLASFFAALALTLFAAAAQAADYYVATTGSANAAGTMAAPWTFAKAISATGAGPGDTVYVRGGTYNGAVNFTRSGLQHRRQQPDGPRAVRCRWTGAATPAPTLTISGVPRAPTPSKGVDGTVREVRV
jgi:hypothetical protein